MVMIGDQQCGAIGSKTSEGKWYTVECLKPITGDFVKVKTTRDDYLHMSGIEVYGQRKVKAQTPKGGSKFEVKSAGFTQGNFATISINDNQVFTTEAKKDGGRGFNVVALEPRTHNVIFKGAFDTYGDNDASANLHQELKELPEGTIFIIGVKDEGSTRLGKHLKKWLKEMGSKEIDTLGFREAYACIGIVGQNAFGEKKGPG
jgi:hypothetical protein